MEKKELSREEWRQQKKEQKARFTAMQNLPYEVKVKRAEIRAFEFIEELDKRGQNAHVSVGGLDSITLLLFLRKIGINIPAVSVSALEDKSIIKIHKQLGVISLRPGKPKKEILQEFGFPVISKKVAGRIETLQNPTDRNTTVRHAIITGECGKQGHYAKSSRMKLPQKWLELFAGYENDNEDVNYKIAPFKVSNKSCLYMKEKPCDQWARENKSRPFLGLMASEGGQREEALVEHGCNYFGKTVIRSAPFAPFLRQMYQYQRSMERLREKKMERSILQKRKELDAVCVDLAFIWRSVRIDLTSSGSETIRNGSSGCTDVAQIQRPGKYTDGGRS